jgi:phosphate starvation-inducible membrane PsiE
MSHPSDTPHSSHVESRSRKALRSYIIQASTLLEIVLSGLVLIGLLLSFIPLLKWMPGLLFDGNDVEIRGFLERALDIVIGVEFIKMLAKHSPGSSLEVLLYAIARHMVVGHESALDNLISVGAIALIFVVRKFFFVPAFGAHLPDGGNTHIEPVIADEIQGIDGMRKRHGKPAGIQVRRTGKFPFVTGLLCRFYYCIETYPAASDFRIAANNGSTLVDGA